MNILHEEVVKIRTIKDYESAHNHLFVGRVISYDNSGIRLNCYTFHFGKIVNEMKDIQQGEWSCRVVPWSRIEMLNVLHEDFMLHESKLEENSGEWQFTDGKHSCCIFRKRSAY